MIDYVADARETIQAMDYEAIRYCPYKGLPRPINVLIERNPPELEFALDGTTQKSIRRVHMVRHNIHGVTRPQYGQDTVMLKNNRWDDVETIFTVQNEVHQDDPGMIVLDVVK